VTIAWWMYLVAGLVLGAASAFCAMLGLSAGTAYSTDYHTLTTRQRAMAKMLGLGALACALVCGLAGLALAAWGLRALWLLL
jgi:hypothetical protein